ncbi:hypothetical protein [Eubacterium sp.]|uniref:hypothetical protein n=1 Tax=Eubacterium sp. TaxID=142586 RepID=UPI0026DFEB5B|nr:hypothetical protein [Eubacterium sp.]MDO5433342.1 hypothetical protein [Eubacterium sp.]
MSKKEMLLDATRTMLLSPEKDPCSHCIYGKACDQYALSQILGIKAEDMIVSKKNESDSTLQCELGVYRYLQREQENRLTKKHE